MSRCVIEKCKTSAFNKLPGVTLHRFPRTYEIKIKWLKQLRGKCFQIDWSKSRICSRHFEKNCFDSRKQLLEHAVPTIFPGSKEFDKVLVQSKFSKMLQEMSNMPNSDIMDDIRRNLSEIKQPTNLDDYLADDAKQLQCKPDAPMEAKLWFLIRKMHLLCNKSMITEARNKGNIEVCQKSLDEVKSKCRDLERSTDTYKYIIKCLQEKQATLEEQVEILTAVESK